MAKIEDLIDEVGDPRLREDLAREVKDIKETKRFGLVFEEHIPETVSLFGLPIRPGLIVQNRTTPQNLTEYEVIGVEEGKATLVPRGADEPESTVDAEDLLVVKRFYEPIFPGLTETGEIRRGPNDKPAHVVINGENFHALQVLTYAYTGKVDCIYIDPPYNTGDKSWKYNNRFVDDNDSYRHSKWLSFMDKRLRLARGLLKEDSVLIVTVDEHEVHHLGVLLEQLFPEARRQMVTIVNNAAGVTQGGFYRVEEHAMFCFFGEAKPVPVTDDLLSDERRTRKTPIWRQLNRYSGTNVSAAKRPGLVYPIFVDVERVRIVDTGRTLKERVESGEVGGDLNSWRPTDDEGPQGTASIWPMKGDGSMSTWEVNPSTLVRLVDEGFVRVRRKRDGDDPDAFSLTYVKSGNRKKVADGAIESLGREPDNGPIILGEVERRVVPKTVWRRTRHDAGKWGSRALRELLGSVTFDYAKSPYAVLDTLRTVVGDNPDATVLDFFAGSGTTLQSTAMLNAEDGGRRRCILVTNNQVDDEAEKLLGDEGHYQGDSQYEAQGICESVTIPRVEAALTGLRNGEPIEGEYQSGRAISEGFDENAVFFRLEYLEPDLVELGRQFNAINPMLWMAAGSIGSLEAWDGKAPWLIPDDSNYGVLFDEEMFSDFLEQVDAADVSHVWLVTNSSSAFVEMRSALPNDVTSARQLYADYLRNFVVNAPGMLRR